MSYHIRRRGLGATQGNWTYSQDENGNWVATPNPQAPMFLGSSPNATGGETYVAAANPLLISNPTGQDFLGGTQQFNPNFYATQSAAQQFASALGGTVIQDPNSTFMTGPTQLAIRLPDGTTVNAGAIASILGNDAAFPGDTTKSGEIAKLLGAAYNPNLASALRSGESIPLAAAPAAPGYIPTPLSRSYVAPKSAAVAPSTPASSAPASSAAPIVTSSNAPPAAVSPLPLPASAASGGGWSDFLKGSSLWGIPNLALGLAALAALFMFSGGGHGHR